MTLTVLSPSYAELSFSSYSRSYESCPGSLRLFDAVNLPSLHCTCKSSLSLEDLRWSAKIVSPVAIESLPSPFAFISFGLLPSLLISPCSTPCPLWDPSAVTLYLVFVLIFLVISVTLLLGKLFALIENLSLPSIDAKLNNRFPCCPPSVNILNLTSLTGGLGGVFSFTSLPPHAKC